MSEPIVRLENVGVAFNAQLRVGSPRFWALEDVSLSLARGDRLGVVGRNGCGKSTLLRTIAGIITPDRGRLTRAPVSCQLLSLTLGFVPHLSGRDNAVLSGLMLGLRRREIVSRLPAILDFSELGEFFDQPISSYSTGMLMRLGFSVAIQVDPDVLLIDEVLAVGDAEFQEKCQVKFAQLKKAGRTVILVSHDMVQVRKMCDTVAWLKNGDLVTVGEAEQTIAAYTDSLQGEEP